MKLIGLLLVRNEDWVLALSARAALEWCEELVIFLHCCTDSTPAIVADLKAEYPGRVHTLTSNDPKWDEMQQRQLMLDHARLMGATHLAMIDADELPAANVVEKLRGYVERLPSGEILQVPLYNLRGSLTRYHANGLWGNRIVSIAFKDDPAFHWAGDTFHSREPRGLTRKVWSVNDLGGGVLHLWGANEERLKARHRYYRCVERVRWPNKPVADIEQMYSMYLNGWRRGESATWQYADVPPEWWQGYEQRGWMKYLNVDAPPWQDAECERLIAEHGREFFNGLTV